jgi:hypothetical protein
MGNEAKHYGDQFLKIEQSEETSFSAKEQVLHDEEAAIVPAGTLQNVTNA